MDGWGEVVIGDVERARAERDHWIRLFNRLEAAVTHHCHAKGSWSDQDDDALYAARAKILKDASVKA